MQIRRRSHKLLALVVFLTLAVPLSAGFADPAWAETFTVDSRNDGTDVQPGDGRCAAEAGGCTLRAAIMETNALSGQDGVSIPAGSYVTSIAEANEDASRTGDLDITGNVIIAGTGGGSKTIDGGDKQIDQVFDIRPGGRR